MNPIMMTVSSRRSAQKCQGRNCCRRCAYQTAAVPARASVEKASAIQLGIGRVFQIRSVIPRTYVTPMITIRLRRASPCRAVSSNSCSCANSASMLLRSVSRSVVT